jgi:hypothetical protein
MAIRASTCPEIYSYWRGLTPSTCRCRWRGREVDLSLASTFNYLDSLKLGEPVDKAALFNAGTLTIGVGPNSKDVVIAENQTLEQIAAAINGVADIGVTATIQESGDNRQISLKPKDGSSASAINIAVTGETGTNLSLASTFSL